jgi:hypothetical protein
MLALHGGILQEGRAQERIRVGRPREVRQPLGGFAGKQRRARAPSVLGALGDLGLSVYLPFYANERNGHTANMLKPHVI